MIIDQPKPGGDIDAKERQALYVEDLDRINEQAKNVLPGLGIAAPCCKMPMLTVKYFREHKSIILFCPKCGKGCGEIKVAEKGTSIICSNKILPTI